MDFVSALDHGIAPTASVLNQSFADYFVPLPVNAAGLAAMVRQDSVDLAASQVWMQEKLPVGVLLHAQRGWQARLAAMGIVPAARRHGLGTHMMETWIADCRRQGLRRLVLEVIGANTAACRLYERHGFAPVQRLAGWEASAEVAAEKVAVVPEPVDLRKVSRAISARDEDGAWPWQLAAESIAQLGPPWSGWQWRGAALVVSDLSAPVVSVRGVVWSTAAGQSAAAALLRALMGCHAGKTWRAPAIFPEAWGPVFSEAGWQPSKLDQWQMVLPLS